MALLFPPPPHALSPKPPFPSTLRSTRPLSLRRATAAAAAGAGVSSSSPSTSSPEKAPALDVASGKRGGKKRRSLKPSFEKQAIRRWSARAPSQRASFPWQQQQQQQQPGGGEGEAAGDQESGWSGSSTLQSIVDYFDFDYDSSDGDGDGVVVGGEAAEAQEDGPRPEPSFLLGSRPVSAPWMHGEEEPMTNQLVSDEEGLDGDGASEDEMGLVDEDGDEDEDLGSEEETLGDSSDGEFSEDYAAPAANSSSMMDSVLDHVSSGGGFYRGTRRSSVNSIVNTMRNSMEESSRNAAIECPETEDFVQKLGPVLLPWEREGDVDRPRKRSNTELAERTIPEHELRRLRDVALRMKERMRVGPGGVTQLIVESIHQKWRVEEVVKLRFEGPPSLNMKRTHDILEERTGGIVIWRSGRSVVLYRGMNYNLRCVQSYTQTTEVNFDKRVSSNSVEPIHVEHKFQKSGADGLNRSAYIVNSSEKPTETFDIDSFLDQLGPRYKDWSGRGPIPVDADLLPGVVPGYKTPFRLLPYKVKSTLRNKEMTALRRLARQTAPHFALGRNREHQGLATAIVKLWEKSSIAKIAIKRGVPNTCNDRMAEEIRKLTGGVLLSRNKEYIVFYRGNDFITPKVRQVLVEKQEQAITWQDEEELARLKASASISVKPKVFKNPPVAGTLTETREAKSRWGDSINAELRKKEKNHMILTKHTSLLRNLKRKLILAKTKVIKAEKALAKVQEFLSPAELPTDLETVTDEERFLLRRIGLKMKAFLMLGRREVFDGTVQNMHLHWKHRELVKVLVKGKSFPQVKHIAISLEAESGGVLISVDKTTKGYAIILYRGKNYKTPQILKPRNLLSRRKALARSIELQRREGLNHHISNLRDKIWKLKSQLVRMQVAGEKPDAELLQTVEADLSKDDDKIEDEGEEAYLQTYISEDEEEPEDDQNEYL
ncbi:CRM-domain containing factor CFM3, chloroplastic/mitochondrial-like [Oryza glaberrima]|uniref:CRM-domain containing factor CFM3, chloroplastic/mitochondrial n=2 Tax=Oryza TaxID=4527 RepID=A0A0D3H5Z3_9ORYZ|nr:CRM-domain containing factor CFM3, chloroplastic/mitochondrial-like [Oryza glaberrima]